MTVSSRIKAMGYEEVKLLLQATFKIFDSAKRSDDPANINAEIQFISLFIETIVSRTLNNKANAGTSKHQHAENLKTNYARVKFGVQESVALGFQEAMQRFSKQDIEFYCTVKPVPDPKSSTTH